MLRRRRGQIMKKKRGSGRPFDEHYLRKDIPCGISDCSLCSSFSSLSTSSLLPRSSHYVILTADLCLRHSDVLHHISSAILLQSTHSALERNSAVFARVNSLRKEKVGEWYFFANEHREETFLENGSDDEKEKKAAEWYDEHLKSAFGEEKPELLLLSVDSISEYVKKYLPEDVVVVSATDNMDEDVEMKDVVFPEHLTDDEIREGICGGKIREGRYSRWPKTFFREENRKRGRGGCVWLRKDDTEVLLDSQESANRAVHSDSVYVMFSNDDNKNEGKVVGIAKRNWRAYCGSILETDVSQCRGKRRTLFLPLDKRIPSIRLTSRQLEFIVNKMIVVAIDNWPTKSKHPLGHYMRTLGGVGEKDVESEAILIEHDVPHYDFPKAVIDCLPGDDWRITEEEVSKRWDLRSLRVASVDPPGCCDIDDALHFRYLDESLDANITLRTDVPFEIGVHIADVTHFVREGCEMDLEARRRGTTVYLVDKRIDMLPKLLSENLCSLRSGVERLAFSVIWEFDSLDSCNIRNVRFGKSVIRSCSSLSYPEAQEIIDMHQKGSEKSLLSRDLLCLLHSARILRQRRQEKGALTLASPEVRFNIDMETHNPTDIQLHSSRETNSLVEEFMLLANISIAKRTLQEFPTFALLRRHPPPSVHAFDDLIDAASSVDVRLETGSSRQLNDSLEKAVGPAEKPFFNTLLRILTTRCMQQAVYFSSGELQDDQYHHYGLSTPIYTHFTSPIRRYADILVHRLLSASIGLESLSGTLTNRKEIQNVAHNLNERNRSAQHAERASVELHTILYFRDRREECDAYVISFSSKGANVHVPKYGIEGTVDNLERDSVRVFDKIIVEITVVDERNHRQRLHLRRIECETMETSPQMKRVKKK